MIQLFGKGQSRSFRCLWALEEAGLTYEYTEVDIGSDAAGGTRTEEYLALNFQGKAPTFVDNELVLTESAAIVNYIASLAPEKELIPGDTQLRARYDEICYFVLSDLEQPLWTTGKHRFVLPEAQRVPEVLTTAAWEFTKSLKALENHLGENQYALGNRFTCADILIAQTIHWADRFKMDLPERFRKYRDEMYSRPACQRASEKLS